MDYEKVFTEEFWECFSDVPSTESEHNVSDKEIEEKSDSGIFSNRKRNTRILSDIDTDSDQNQNIAGVNKMLVIIYAININHHCNRNIWRYSKNDYVSWNIGKRCWHC